jgi:hypothetical protein
MFKLSILTNIFSFSKKIKAYDYLIINLIIADLVMIIPNLPFAAYNSYFGRWMFGQLGN